MQTIQLDISKKTEIVVIEAKQDDVGRKFRAVILENGEPYFIPKGAKISLWYSGAGGEGNYTEINGENPFLVYENTVTVELISQMLRLPGGGQMCLVILDEHGGQVGLWNIPYHVEKIPGTGSEGAKDYFSAFTKMLQDIEVDASLSVAGRPADAKAVGEALQTMIRERTDIACYVLKDDTQLDNKLLSIISHMRPWSQYHCVMFMEGTDATLPYGMWVFALTRTDTQIQILGSSGSKTVSRTYTESMLKNGSFEVIPKIPGWNAKDPATSFVSSEVTRSGQFALMIRDTRTNAGEQVVSDPIAATAGASYCASAYVCGTAVSMLRLRFVNAEGYVLGEKYSTVTPTDSSWSAITVTEVAPAGTAQMHVALETAEAYQGTAYFDDVELKEVGYSNNLLKNPSFETEISIDGWTSNSMKDTLLTCENLRVGNGSFAVKLVNSATASGVELTSDPIVITGGKEYGVSVDLCGQGMCQLWIRYFDAYGDLVGQKHKTIVPLANAWSGFWLAAIAPVEAVKACVVINTTESGSACIYVDNVFLAPIDEIGELKSNVDRFSGWFWPEEGGRIMDVGGVLESLDDLSSLTCRTLTQMSVSEKRELAVICDFLYQTTAACLTLRKMQGMDSVYEATATLTTATGDFLSGYTVDYSLEGQWQAIQWEWSNPPMEEGIEYRTTERNLGKPVYTQLVNLGKMPNKTGKYYAHGLSMTQIVKFHAYISGGDSLPAVFSANGYSATIYCSMSYIIIETSTDMSAKTAYAQIWYTKD